MAEIDANGLQEDMDQDDMTTLIVQVAKELKTASNKVIEEQNLITE